MARVNGRVPRYLQIAETLRERIRGGALSAGARLDNQRALAREFEVTLMTLRQALELLERDGLIVRHHGLGTFVASPSIDYDILHLRTFAGDLSAKGEAVETRFLASEFRQPDRRVAQGLRLGRGEEVAKADLAVTPLRSALSFKLGIEITRAHETVFAVTLRSREARELGCRPGIPAFRSERISWAGDGAPIVYDRVFIPGDRFWISRELTYEGVRP